MQRTAVQRTAATAAALKARQNQMRRSSVLAFARAQVGKSYRYGAAGPRAYDCSGLTMRAFAKAGVKLPHQASRQGRKGKPIARRHALPGDLMIWGSGHAAVYAGGNKMIDSARPGVKIGIRKIWGNPRFYRVIN